MRSGTPPPQVQVRSAAAALARREAQLLEGPAVGPSGFRRPLVVSTSAFRNLVENAFPDGPLKYMQCLILQAVQETSETQTSPNPLPFGT